VQRWRRSLFIDCCAQKDGQTESSITISRRSLRSLGGY